MLTDSFLEVDGISYVTSLTNVLDLKKLDDGIEIGRLVDEYHLPRTAGELLALKNYTLSKDFYRNRLVSEDARATVIICRLAPDADGIKIMERLKQIIRTSGVSEKVYCGGHPVLISDLSTVITSDLKMLLPLVVLVIGLLLYISFRSIRCVVLPMLAVAMSSIWTIGLMSLFKIPLTIISNIMPIILVAVGSAYSIHVMSKIREDAVAGNDRYSRAAGSLSQVILPVFFAAVTTMAGFISFVFGAYLTMINEFGIFSSLGVFFAFLISVTFVPAMMVSLREGRPEKQNAIAEEKTRSRVMCLLARIIVKNKLLVIVVFLVLFTVSAAGIPGIVRQVDIIDYFKPNMPTRLAEKELQERFGGSASMQVLVEGDIGDPAVLRQMKDMERFLETISSVRHPHSIAGILEEMNSLMGEGRQIPDRREKVSNLWFLIEGEDIVRQMVNEERTEALIQATLGKNDVSLTNRIINEIEDYITMHAREGIRFTQTGMHFIHKKIDRAILFNQTQSLIIALVIVFIIVAFLLRSVAGGLAGLVPISSALLVVFGVMGYCRIPLDLATMLVAGIAIGTGIDYAIHFTTRLRWESLNEPDPEKALARTLDSTGKAILINVATVALGFLVLVFSNLIPIQRFGMLIAIVTLGAGLGAITLLPAVMLSSGAGINNKRRKK
jgi:predicted RND superfamily exporter protein